MKIENLSKDLDTESMSEVKGGLALTGQVVPTNVQSNALEQAFNIARTARLRLPTTAASRMSRTRRASCRWARFS